MCVRIWGRGMIDGVQGLWLAVSQGCIFECGFKNNVNLFQFYWQVCICSAHFPTKYPLRFWLLGSLGRAHLVPTLVCMDQRAWTSPFVFKL